MTKNEKGVLTIEASIVLCAFSLFILFLFNFATVYRAENMVSHATLQAADAVALESYLRETSFETETQRVLFWANRINGVDNISEDSFESLRTADLQTIAKEKFALAIGNNAIEASKILKGLGVKGGVDGIDFSESHVDLSHNDVVVKANYTVQLRFPVFGAKELSISKAAKAKTAGEILFGLQVIPEQQIQGTTQGSGKYKFGTEVQISAEANYGYDFTSWDDGNRDNPRKVTVTEAKTYIAKFSRHNFGVNLFISDPTSPNGRVRGSNTYGEVTAISGNSSAIGGGEYSYESTVTVKATANRGYEFDGWHGSKVSDSGTESIHKGKNDSQFEVFINGTYDLTAKFKPLEYTVSVSTDCTAASAGIGVRKYGAREYEKSVAVEYGNQIELYAPLLGGYTFLGWYKDDVKVTAKNDETIPLPLDGGNYVAKYEKDPIIRVVTNGHGTVKIAANGQNNYCCKRGTSVNVVATPQSGYYFAGWSDGGAVSHWVTVNADITLTATFQPLYKISVTAGNGGTASGGGSSFKSGEKATITASPSTGYHFVKWQMSTNGGTSYNDVSRDNPYKPTVTGNVIYKAVFEANTYTVTLNPNGGSLKSTSSYTVKYNGSTGVLPKPVRQGYRFTGWKSGGSTYASGSKVSGVTGNMSLVAQWSRCSKHVWGRCGITHTATTPCYLSQHSNSHKTSKFQCVVCVECGKFDSGTCGCANFNSNLDRSKIGLIHLCYTTTACTNLWNNKYKESNGKVYNVHAEYGYP